MGEGGGSAKSGRVDWDFGFEGEEADDLDVLCSPLRKEDRELEQVEDRDLSWAVFEVCQALTACYDASFAKYKILADDFVVAVAEESSVGIGVEEAQVSVTLKTPSFCDSMPERM